MTTINAQLVGDKALITRAALDQLVELAGRTEPVELRAEEEDLPALGMMRLAEQGGAFDFWTTEGEEIYSITDGEGT